MKIFEIEEAIKILREDLKIIKATIKDAKNREFDELVNKGASIELGISDLSSTKNKFLRNGKFDSVDEYFYKKYVIPILRQIKNRNI